MRCLLQTFSSGITLDMFFFTLFELYTRVSRLPAELHKLSKSNQILQYGAIVLVCGLVWAPIFNTDCDFYFHN